MIISKKPENYDAARFFVYLYNLKKVDKRIRSGKAKELEEIVSHLLKEVSNHIKNKPSNRKKYQPNPIHYRTAVGLVVLNFLNEKRFKKGNHPTDTIFKYTKKLGIDYLKREDSLFYKSECLEKAINSMVDLNYLDRWIGHHKTASALIMKQKLFDLFEEKFSSTIQIPDDTFPLIEEKSRLLVKVFPKIKGAEYECYPDLTNRKVQKLNKEVMAYQTFIRGYEFDFTPFSEADKAHYPLRQFSVYRRFQADKKDEINHLNKGGRFYGPPHQNLSKKARNSFKFKKKGESKYSNMIEIDFPSLHPRLMYIITGQGAAQEKIKDLYAVPDRNGGFYPRKVIKKALLIRINAESGRGFKQQIVSLIEDLLGVDKTKWKYKKARNHMDMSNETPLDPSDPERAKLARLYNQFVDPSGKYWKAFLYDMKKFYSPIWEYLNKPLIWRDLNLLDSEIAHIIHMETMERGYPALSVHDSFIVPEDKKDEVSEISKHAYIKAIKKIRGIRVKPEWVHPLQ